MKLQRKGEFLSTRVQYIPLGRIRPNPQQPRRSFDEEDLAELAAFARRAQADEETPARMRAYAESHMSWQGVLAQVLERVGIECPER